MSQTVIGIFEYTSEAQEAKSFLLANGFSNENVDIDASGALSTTDGDAGDRISGFFSNLFTSNDEAETYTNAGRKGTIVTVHAGDNEEAEKAAQVLDNYGALDVNEFSQRANQAGTGYNPDTADQTTGTIPVINEELLVNKREVETGGVRLRSRIVERPVEESIRLREEHVSVERTPVDRPATKADFANFKEGTIELTEHAERAVVSKDARVVEEVSLGKEVSEKEKTIRDSVRHTEVSTENIKGTENTDTDNSYRADKQ